MSEVKELTTPAQFIEDKIHDAFLELAELVADGTFELDHPSPLIFASMHLTNCWKKYLAKEKAA